MILIFGKHVRDERRMVKEAKTYFPNANNEILCIRFFPLTTFEIWLNKGLRFRPPSSGPSILNWPQLANGTNTDSAHVAKSNRLVTHLTQNFSRCSHVFVGDSHQSSTYVAKQIRDKQKSSIVLSPEGLGVFRSRFGGYRWVSVPKKTSLAMLAKLLFTNRPRLPTSQFPNKRSQVNGYWWTLIHLVQSLLYTNPEGLDPLSLPSVDVTISDWDEAVDFGIKTAAHIKKSNRLEQTKGHTYRMAKGLAYFVADVTECSAQEWVWIFESLKDWDIERMLIKERGGNASAEALIEGARRAFPGKQVVVQKDGLAEETISELRPEFVIGVESTVLLNIGLLEPEIKVISVARSVAQVSRARLAPREASPDTESYALRALEICLGDRLEIV